MNKIKRPFITSVVSLLLCVCMLLGTTWAWFTDGVTSAGNKIQAGTLRVDLELLDQESGQWSSLKKDQSPLFDYDNWEPGYIDVKILKIENEGNLALKWVAQFVSENDLSILANVIDVYVCPSKTELAYPADRSLAGYKRVGTVADFVNTIEKTTYGTLEAGACAYLGIALKMRELAGNEYQSLSLGGAFDILIHATQWTSESDSFNDQYDKDATYPSVTNGLQISTDISNKTENGLLTEAVIINDAESGVSVTLPAGTAVEASTLTLRLSADSVNANVTLDVRVGYDVSIEGVAEGNTAVILITIPGMLPAEQSAVQLYHEDNMMKREFTLADVGADEFVYDATTGNVTFGLTHFSNLSAGATTSVYVNGVKYEGTVISLNDRTERVTVPADGNVYILTFDNGDGQRRNAYSPAGTHYGSYNLNPGDSMDETKQYNTHGVLVEVGATVILNNVSIRTNGYVDAIQVGYELAEMQETGKGNNSGAKTKILVADGTYNCLVGQSGISFGYYTGADLYIEGGGCLYPVARRNACPAIGTCDQTDGGATDFAPSGPKVTINVGWMVAMPGKGAAGIGGGFKENKHWSGMSAITINGGAMQIYAGADATAIGAGKVGNCGEIVINGGDVYLYLPAALTNGNTMGFSKYGGSCKGIYVSEDANVVYGTGMSWDSCVVSSGQKKINGFTRLDSIEATADASGNVTRLVGSFGETNKELDPTKAIVKESRVSIGAILWDDKVIYLTCSAPVSAEIEKAKSVDFLYRVGNQNAVTKAQLSMMLTGKESTEVDVETANIGSASATVNGDNITFSGTGVMEVTINGILYYVEVVDAYNVTNIGASSDSGYDETYLGHGSTYSRNSVLLNDLTYENDGNVNHSIDLYNCTVYGNGFTLNVANALNNYTNFGVIWLNNSNLDNVQIIGGIYRSYNASTGSEYEESSSVIRVSGSCSITNSYVSGCRSQIYLTGDLYLENTYLQGGRYANIDVRSGSLELVDVTTNNMPKDDVAGFGIVIHQDATTVTSIKINGLTQYNWLAQNGDAQYFTNVADDENNVMGNLFNNAFVNGATFTYDGDTYVNVGIMSGTNTISSTIVTGYDSTCKVFAQDKYWAISNDNTKYTFTGEELTAPEYNPNASCYIKPTFTWDDAVSNGSYNISFESGQTGTLPEGLLTATKYGYDLDVTVSGTTSFTKSGTYTVTYTVTDPYNYDKDGKQITTAETYTLTLTVNVSVTEPAVSAPEFTFTSSNTSYSTSDETMVTKTDNNGNVWITPVVENEAAGVTSIAVNGITVYAIQVEALDVIAYSGTTKGYRRCIPIFAGISIVDGERKYNDQTTSMPEEYVKWVTADDADYCKKLRLETEWSGYKTSADLKKPTDHTGVMRISGYFSQGTYDKHTIPTPGYPIQFSYTGKNGVTYNYYICYTADKEYETGQYDSSCFTPDTLITLADGTQKRVDELTFNDKILAWDFFTGAYVAKDISLLVNHGEDLYRIANLKFSNGETLRIIADHGIFDYDLNKFVYLTVDNMHEYIGHRFVTYSPDGSYGIVTLTEAYETEEYTSAWSITSAGTSNAFASGLLTVAPPEDFYNWIEMDGKLHYDVEQFQKDVETYGLYTYDDFKDYVTYEQFVDWNGAYLKIAVEKGYFTFNYILELIELYKGWMP